MPFYNSAEYRCMRSDAEFGNPTHPKRDELFSVNQLQGFGRFLDPDKVETSIPSAVLHGRRISIG
ncbi:hypothetical protein RRF57_002566 [Xylaria bambusicola]|uniref:Uncharacterized protein n=1 Tax=Xylaria bambusicola TaxID=326684 RepID=A0AAN7UIX2_9PEZI